MSTVTKIRIWIVLFVLALAAAGLTAFPLQWELGIASDVLHSLSVAQWLPGLTEWIDHVRDALNDTYPKYPFIAYGTDWLAYAHIVIAIAFIGPFRDPVRNIWIVQWAMIACVLVIPLALIAGAIREIPIAWQLIDMSFGVFGLIPLIIVYRLIRRLERENA
jgi:succinate-acetate transporter protein